MLIKKKKKQWESRQQWAMPPSIYALLSTLLC